jgi:hypothetical protein
MAELVYKTPPKPTVVLGLRVEAELKDEYAKVRKIADRQHMDLPIMISAALRELFKSITSAPSSKVASLNDRRSSE